MAAPTQIIDAISTEHLHTDLKGRSVRGGFWTLSSQGAQFVMQSVSTVVLARLLMPADFGLVAMVMAITSLGQAFADLGLSEATIQRTEISHEQISTLFWINVAIGLGLTLATAALAPLLVWFYQEPRLRDITLVTSLTFLIGGLRVQHTALLKRQMRFFALGIRDVVSYALAVPLAIALALRGSGYWAIVALPLTLNFTQMALSWLMVRWLPGLPRRGVKVRSLIVFGGNVAASYFVTNLTRSADSILIGWYWGAGPLGLYSRAYNLLMLPVRQLSGPAGSVAVPAFSRIHDDPERFARYYLRAVNLIIWISAPVFGFLFVAAMPVIVLVLGSKWGEAAPVFQILVISALGQLLLDSTIWLFVSRGQSARLLKLLLFVSPVMVGSFAFGLRFGIKGVALSGSLVLLAIFPWLLKFTFRGTDLTLPRLGEAILKPISVALCGVALAELGSRLIAPQRTVTQLLTAAICFAAAYSLSLLSAGVRREIRAFGSLLKKSETAVLMESAESLETVSL
jgi:O-antigen/teichoic acid export membrane protein